MTDAQRRIAWLAHGVLAVLVLGLACTLARDPDLGFHLATGRAVLGLGHVPGTNVLSYGEPDAVAINQQWLPAVFFELAFRALGIAGPTLVKALMLVGTFALVLRTARLLGARPMPALLACSLGAWGASVRFVERPLLFSNLAVVVTAWCLARLAAEPRRPLGPCLWAGLALCTAVHMHAGVVFGFALLVAHALGLLGLGALGRAGDRRVAVWLLSTCAAALVVSALVLALYHPHGLKVLLVPFQMGADPFLHDVLPEFRHPWQVPFTDIAPFWLFVAATVLAVAAVARQVPLAAWLPLLLGLSLSLRHVRFLDLAILLGAPALALALSLLVERLGDGRALHRAALGLTLILGITRIAHLARTGELGFGFDPRTWPRALLDDADRTGLRGRAFVQDGWAGPFLGLRYPHERVFFHPNFESYSVRFYRDEYLRTRDGEPGWDDRLDRYDVNWVLMKYTSPGERKRQHDQPNLRQRLAGDPRWALVSFDDYGMLFARRASLVPTSLTLLIEGLDVDRGVFLDGTTRARPGLLALARRGRTSRRLEALLDATARPDPSDR
jgi:hypothetical protein